VGSSTVWFGCRVDVRPRGIELSGFSASGSVFCILLEPKAEEEEVADEEDGLCSIGHFAPNVVATLGRSGLGGGIGIVGLEEDPDAEPDDVEASCIGHAGGGRRDAVADVPLGSSGWSLGMIELLWPGASDAADGYEDELEPMLNFISGERC
jgi:hypothetical protein